MVGYFGKMGWVIGLWVVLSLLCELLLSVWVMLCELVGYWVVSVGFILLYVVVLFIVVCIVVIVYIFW